jgi:predicted ATP-grasp superfamily ATP-dependent carboligase
MTPSHPETLTIDRLPALDHATLVLALTGWMDGGDVSTGTVSRLVHMLGAGRIAEIDPEPFYLYNFPGSMEVASLFRPLVEIENGLLKSLEMPSNIFYAHEPARLIFFLGKEPNLRWRTFGDCILWLAGRTGVERILFVGSFGGTVPHTRQPRLFVSGSDASHVQEMQRYGFQPSTYKGPGSFTTYLMTQAESAGIEMISLVAEIPSYLQGTNPASIEAVTRRLAKILHLPLDLAALRTASTQWELEVSSAVDENQELANTIRQLEEAYDNELLEQEKDEA